MGYLRKDSTVANPAKKSLTVFQNSYQVWDHDDVVTGTRSIPIYGKAGWRMDEVHQDYAGSAWSIHNESAFPIRVVNNGSTTTVPIGAHYYTPYIQQRLETPKVYNANTGAFIAQTTNYSATVQTGSRTETYEISRTPIYRTEWNTKWSKLSA